MKPDRFLELVKQNAEGVQPNADAMLHCIGACNAISASPVGQAKQGATNFTALVSRNHNSSRNI